MEKEFNQQKYIREYKKKHYKEFRAYLKPDEYDDLMLLLEKYKINKPDFLRKAIKQLKKEPFI